MISIIKCDKKLKILMTAVIAEATHGRSEATTGLQGFTSSRPTTQLPLRRLHTRASLVHAPLRNSHCGGYTRSIGGYNGSAGLH